MLDPKPCYRQGGCGPYENYSCSECPASKPEYAERYKKEKPKMRAILVIDGKEFPIDILDPDLQEIIKPKTARHTGYERVRRGDRYWIDEVYRVSMFPEENEPEDKSWYELANYYSDLSVAENNCRADKLMRSLRRFAVKHRVDKIDWNNSTTLKYTIRFNNSNGLSVTQECCGRDFGAIFFDSYKTAERAIEEFKDELTWYFTEYKDSL